MMKDMALLFNCLLNKLVSICINLIRTKNIPNLIKAKCRFNKFKNKNPSLSV